MRRESRVMPYLGLFSSVATLICCALPSLLVFLGFGATVAALLSAAPWLVSLSRHKGWIFAGSALLLGAGFYYVHRLAPRLLVAAGTCPADDPGACVRVTGVSRAVLWVALVVYVIGWGVAYLLPAVLARMNP